MAGIPAIFLVPIEINQSARIGSKAPFGREPNAAVLRYGSRYACWEPAATTLEAHQMEGEMWLALTSIVLATAIGLEVLAVAARRAGESARADREPDGSPRAR
jgi:hypothetical protein